MSTVYCCECGDAEYHHNLIRNRVWVENGKVKKRKLSPICPTCYASIFPNDGLEVEQ